MFVLQIWWRTGSAEMLDIVRTLNTCLDRLCRRSLLHS